MHSSEHSLYQLTALPRVVPWMSWDEWKQVYFWLFDPDPAIARQGLKRVAAWENRGKVPLSVEVTAKLIEAVVNDRERYVNFRSETEIRMLYSMAISRMVNGLVQTYQRGAFAISMANIGSSLGLPNILIETRHRASHKELPSLATLRLAATEALKWLQTHYWEQQLQHLHHLSETIKTVLKRYRLLQKRFTSSHSLTSFKFRSLRQRLERKRLLKKFLEVVTPSQITSTVIPLLLDNNFLVPLPKDPSKATAIPKVLPRRLILMWADFLKRLGRLWPLFLDTLLITIVQRIVQTTKSVIPDKRLRQRYRSLLVCWYSFLLNGFTNPSHNTQTSQLYKFSDVTKNNTNCPTKRRSSSVDRNLSETEFNAQPQPKKSNSSLPSTVFSSQILSTVVQMCILHPSRWTAKILENTIPFLEHCKQSTITKTTALQLLTLLNKIVHLKLVQKSILSERRISILNNESMMEDNSLFGFEELKQRVNELIHRSQKSVSTATVSETVWTLCDDSVLPGLGQSVVGTLPDLTLPESLDYYNGSFVVLPSIGEGLELNNEMMTTPENETSNVEMTETVSSPLTSIPRVSVPFAPTFSVSIHNQVNGTVSLHSDDQVEFDEDREMSNETFNVEQLRDGIHLLFSPSTQHSNK